MKKLDEALVLAKELHSHSILHNDVYYTDKLLQIVINLSLIDEQIPVNTNLGSYPDEIKKVKRKVPKWMKKTHQYNYKILEAYMTLSNNNLHPIHLDELEDYVDIGTVFLGHYNGLKTISEKNHAKVFNEIDRMVKLWEPVAEFIMELFQNKQMDVDMLEKNEDVIKIRIGDFIKEHIPNIVDLCELDSEELHNLQQVEYSNNMLGLGKKYSFAGLHDKVEQGRYWVEEYEIKNNKYRFCSQFGGGAVDSTGQTLSQRTGDVVKRYLSDKNILLEHYKNKEIQFIVG